ncbi:MAG: hypothetical protein K8W52_27550 [Deltaproteobacteria bacterium]|nr:hypothetical protein [Deltaproteobacteria bacterium]
MSNRPTTPSLRATRALLPLALAAAALFATGCYDSLVKNQCAPGYVLDGDGCRAVADAADGDASRIDASIDGGGGDGGDAAWSDAGIDGALIDGALSDGALIDGALSDGGSGDGSLNDAATGDGGSSGDGSAPDAGKPVDAGAALDGGGVADGGASTDAGALTDAMPTTDATPGPDALVCVLPEIACATGCIDPFTDPDNCGRCGNVCASGICTNGFCSGEVTGHIVLIGHDYSVRHAAAVRVLTNSIGLSGASPMTVAVWRGNANVASIIASEGALGTAMAGLGRPWTRIELGNAPLTNLGAIDVLLIVPQPPDAGELTAAGDTWRVPLHDFVTRGGVIVALSDASDATPERLVGAGLMDVGAAIDVTGQNLTIGVGTDAIAIGVISPYHADTSTAAFTSSNAIPVIVDSAGHAVVLHAAPH